MTARSPIQLWIVHASWQKQQGSCGAGAIVVCVGIDKINFMIINSGTFLHLSERTQTLYTMGTVS